MAGNRRRAAGTATGWATGARTRRRLAASVVAAAVLAGCGVGGDDADEAVEAAPGTVEDDGDGDVAVEDAAVDDAAVEGAAGESAGDEAGATSGETGVDRVVTFGEGATTGRQLARTATVTLEVEDVEVAAREVRTAAVRAGGYVESQDVQGGDFGAGRLTLRVPATALDATIEAVAEAGLTVVRSTVASEDLTDQLVDLRARVANLEALESELTQLLGSVEEADADAAELLTVYDRINAVRGDIERLEAQRAAAADRVALATVDVELVARAIAPEQVDPAPETTLGRAWQATREAFGAIADALVWLGVTILPVALVVVGVPVALVWLLVRALRGRARPADGPPRPDRPSPPTPPAAPADVAAEEPVGVGHD